MPARQPVRLGAVPETLLVPLFALAVESRRKHPILKDPRAVEMVESIDWDFERFNQRPRVIGCNLRCALFDEWVRAFLGEHPEGTVVEIGCGLNTRFERLDNGRAHWIDLDLPEVIELRRKFFTDTERRTMLAASVLDTDWIAAVERSPGPYLFVAETVFIYLQEREVRQTFMQIAQHFPGASIAFDTGGRRAVEGANRDHERRKLAGRFAWACADAKEIEDWNVGLHRVESWAMGDLPEGLRPRLPWTIRAISHVVRALLPKIRRVYQLHLFTIQHAQ